MSNIIGRYIVFFALLLGASYQAKAEFVQFYGFGQTDTIYNANNQPIGLVENGDTIPISADLPFGTDNADHPLFLSDPDNVTEETVYDPETNTYTIRRKIGDSGIEEVEVMDFDEYWEQQFQESQDDYWRERQRADRFNNSGSSLLNPTDDGNRSIFGNDFVDIRPQGTAELTFGVNVMKTENNNLSVKNQTQSPFTFDMKIQMNVVGTIGDKLKLTSSYNTEQTFNFENQMKLEYVGDEDEIIKKIEAGNVTLPLNSSLIQGSQSLFGIKNEMQFGKMRMTSVFSQQKGESKTIEITGGAQRKEFEIRADNYELNKHFFIAHAFKDNYDQALSNLPIVQSAFQINNIEVWTTNTSFGNVQDARNIVAFSDLAENNPSNVIDASLSYNAQFNVPDNDANSLYADMVQSGARNFNNITSIMNSKGYEAGVHYNKIENAVKLSQSQYTVHPQLGYISLNRSLNSDEVLAIAIQYTYNGQVYEIGDMSNDNSISASQTIFLKLIKSTQVNNTRIPLWDLMMKNVYALGEYNIQESSFQLSVLYKNPEGGNMMNYIPEGVNKSKQFVRALNADQLNKQGDALPDGIYDFIDGLTINKENGRIFFPVREPFGKTLRSQFDDPNLANKYAFDSLYTASQNNAQINFPEKNRFYIKGSYESSSSSEISLNAMNVPDGSVVVTAGGAPLQENIDYTVDYTLGRVKIINQSILNSGTPIKISLESSNNFAMQMKSLVGTHMEYEVNKDFNIGGTLMNLSEKPMTNKVNMGDEPISNTVYGINTTYRSEAPYLTKLVDMLPLVETKEKSTVTFAGEFAQLIPGSSRAIKANGEGVAYLDDFEGSQTSITLTTPSAWVLASTPQDASDWPEGQLINNLASGYNRAKLSWYVIDQLFSGSGSLTPDHIKEDPEHQSNNYVRSVQLTEISPNKQVQASTPTNLGVLDLAYYPEERGMYNYDVDGTDINGTIYSAGVDAQGNLLDPASRWGGIMRKIETIDFEAANIEFIEVWMMDPFDADYNEIHNGYDVENHNGGDFIIQLGNISEDILRDSRKFFENGLPTDPNDTALVDESAWGRIPAVPALVNAFNNDPSTRPAQDVGLDGLSTTQEKTFFNSPYLQRLADHHGTSSQAYIKALADPSSDDYNYFRDDDYDADQVPIHERYKKFNGYEGNSPTQEQSSQLNNGGYPTTGSTLPNIEDINRDQTLSEQENYYQYRVSLDPNNMVVGQNYITQVLNATTQTASGINKTVKWYQLKIPIRSSEKKVGTINDYRSIRFMRMILKGFEQPVVCRLGRLELVRGDWRTYNFSMLSQGEYIPNDDLEDTNFEITAVNIEDNAAKTPVPYVLPPGVTQETMVGSVTNTRMNEQSLVMKVCDLQDGDARAGFKNLDMDMRSYSRLQMYTHLESIDNEELLEDGEVTAFIRLGSDFDQNYYEYEIPLKKTKWGDSERELVWPEENNFDFNFKEEFARIKAERTASVDPLLPFTLPGLEHPDHNVSVRGTPNLANVRVIMLGVRNAEDDGTTKCAEIWFNELRLTDFDQSGGWAATASVTGKLADFGQVSLSGFKSTPGWGSIEKKVSERSRETIESFDGTTSLQLGKFLPEKSGIKVPVYMAYSKSTRTPQFNPQENDVEFSNMEDGALKDTLLRQSRVMTERKSINFTNVKKVRTNSSKKPQVYDIENLDFTYAYNQIIQRDFNTEYNVTRNYRGAVNYNYNSKPKNVAPFRKTPLLSHLQRSRLQTFALREKAIKDEIVALRKENPKDPLIQEKEEELKELKETKRNFQQWSNKALRSPWLRPIKDINFYYLPSKISVKGDLNRMYNESKLRNNTTDDLVIDPNFNKNFSFNRLYDLKFDLARGLKMDFQAMNQSRVDEPEGRIDTDEERDIIRQNVYDFGRTTSYNQKLNINYTIPINKFPITSWITSSARYSGSYDWQAAPLAATSFGNVIRNNNTMQINGQANLVNFYNKIGYLKEINRKTASAGPRANVVRSDRGAPKSDKDKPDMKSDSTKADVNYLKEALDFTLRTMMLVRQASLTYSQTNGTELPGFMPSPQILGNELSTMAPGMGFAFGLQEDRETFQQRVYDRGWLTADTMLNTRYSSTFKESYNARVTIEPVKKMRLELTADRDYSERFQEIFRMSADGEMLRLSPISSGGFSMSTITWGSAFEKVNEKNNFESEVFNKFLNTRYNVANYLAANDGFEGSGDIDSSGYPMGYGSQHQDVLVMAFLSAYTGMDPSKSTTPFLKLPKPNWRLNYDGLSMFPKWKKHLNSMQLSHTYRSSFDVSSFQNNLNYTGQYTYGEKVISDRIIMGSVRISEEFSPLFKVDMKWSNNIITKVEFKKNRQMLLNISNKIVTESRGKEFVIGTGYVFKQLYLPLKLMGKKGFKSDLDLRFDLSIRELMMINRTINQTVESSYSTPSSGQTTVALKLSADYKLSERLMIRAFIDRQMNDPLVSNTFKNSNTQIAVSIRFNLAQ